MREIDILESTRGWSLPTSLFALIHPFFTLVEESSDPVDNLREVSLYTRKKGYASVLDITTNCLSSTRFDQPEIAALSRYYVSLFRFLAWTDLPALLVAEECDGARANFSQQESWQLIRQAGYRGDIFFYPTEYSDPTPHVLKIGRPRDDEWSFNHLSRRFNEHNVKELLLGGGRFHKTVPYWPAQATVGKVNRIERNTNYPEFGDWGCLNYFAYMVWQQRNFHQVENITVSPLTFN
jgi:hypothetical protein